MSNKQVEIKIRHWLYINGKKFFGPGRLELLERIQQTGSIVQAARGIGMSYKKAWDMIKVMNDLASTPFVITKKGGARGGGAAITGHCTRLMDAYRKLTQVLEETANTHQEIIALI
ncbi:MAG: LysR family transcriptional regulator [Niabella sp.]